VVYVDEVRAILARIKTATADSIVMPEDHNDQTEAIAKLTDIVESLADIRQDVLDFIAFKKHRTELPHLSGRMYLLFRTGPSWHEVLFSPSDSETKAIYPSSSVEAEYIDLKTHTGTPSRLPGTLWYVRDPHRQRPRPRFSPDGSAIHDLWYG